MDTAKVIRLPAVMAKLGVSKPTIYLWIKKGTFPAPLKIGPKASGWLLSEVDAWIDERANARASN